MNPSTPEPQRLREVDVPPAPRKSFAVPLTQLSQLTRDLENLEKMISTRPSPSSSDTPQSVAPKRHFAQKLPQLETTAQAPPSKPTMQKRPIDLTSAPASSEIELKKMRFGAFVEEKISSALFKTEEQQLATSNNLLCLNHNIQFLRQNMNVLNAHRQIHASHIQKLLESHNDSRKVCASQIQTLNNKLAYQTRLTETRSAELEALKKSHENLKIALIELQNKQNELICVTNQLTTIINEEKSKKEK